jgi:hypothetical protein
MYYSDFLLNRERFMSNPLLLAPDSGDLLGARPYQKLLEVLRNRIYSNITGGCGDGSIPKDYQQIVDVLLCLKYTTENIKELTGSVIVYDDSHDDLQDSKMSLFWPLILLAAGLTVGGAYLAYEAWKGENLVEPEPEPEPVVPEVAPEVVPDDATDSASDVDAELLTTVIQHPSLFSSILLGLSITLVVAAALATPLVMAAGMSVVSGASIGAAGGLISGITAGSCFFNLEKKPVEPEVDVPGLAAYVLRVL